LGFVQPVETALFDQLPYDLEGDLVAPFVHEGHRQIVDEDG
jgi:hypothetical protein